MRYRFEWDPRKAESNKAKHRVAFEEACTVFRDPQALTIYDEKHSEDEDRWITLGLSASGAVLVVSHTFRELDAENVSIRIISGRKATRGEQRHYRG